MQAEERWPTLYQFLVCYLHEDWPIFHGSVSAAIAAAVQEYDLDQRRTVLREWRDWNATDGAQDDVRASVNDGFGVNVHFKEPIEARNLMNQVYDRLMESVRAETKSGRSKPWS